MPDTSPESLLTPEQLAEIEERIRNAPPRKYGRTGDLADLEEALAENAKLRAALEECASWLEARPDMTEGDVATASAAREALGL